MNNTWPEAPLYLEGVEYEKLYENYYQRDPKVLPEACPVGMKGLFVADICCGSAPVAKAALEMGAVKALAVDAQYEMLPKEPKVGLTCIHAHVADFLSSRSEDPEKIDVIFCRQAVNYWMLSVQDAGRLLSEALVENGYVIFNTFLDKPSEEPTVRVTGVGDDRMIETMWLAPDGALHHSQFRSGHKPHATKFDWISQENFMKILEPYFEVSVKRKGSGAIFVCRKK